VRLGNSVRLALSEANQQLWDSVWFQLQMQNKKGGGLPPRSHHGNWETVFFIFRALWA
jgi:hypothetical protein